jgi:hypothetical protein
VNLAEARRELDAFLQRCFLRLPSDELQQFLDEEAKRLEALAAAFRQTRPLFEDPVTGDFFDAMPEHSKDVH